jgi:hypothetical protein
MRIAGPAYVETTRCRPAASRGVEEDDGGARAITIFSEPDFVVSCVEVAVMVAVPAVELAVNSPAAEIVPAEAGLTDHVTVLAYAPVPATVAAHSEVCVVRMESETHRTVTPVTVGAAETVTVALPALVPSCVDVAVIVAVPAVELGVKTPVAVIVPAVLGLTDHVTVLA